MASLVASKAERKGFNRCAIDAPLYYNICGSRKPHRASCLLRTTRLNSIALTSTMFTSEAANVAFAGKVLILVSCGIITDFQIPNEQPANRFRRKRRTTRRRSAHCQLEPQSPGVSGRFLSRSGYWRARRWSPGCFHST